MKSRDLSTLSVSDMLLPFRCSTLKGIYLTIYD